MEPQLVGALGVVTLIRFRTSQRRIRVTPSSPQFPLTYTSLQGANLNNAYLQQISLVQAHLQGANLQEADLQSTFLQFANFQGADLQQAKIHRSNLQGTDFQNANLQEADLKNAFFQGTKLQGANLAGSDLREADNLTTEQVRTAKNWDKAHYDPKFREQLGLPPETSENQ